MNPATMSVFSKIIGIVGMVFGLPFLGFGVAFSVMEGNFQRDAVAVRGLVAEVVQEKRAMSDDDTPSTYFFPVFQYRDASGKEHRVKSSMGSGSAAVQAGQTVDLLYRAGDAENVRMADETGYWIFAAVFGGFGVLFTGGGALLVFVVSPRFARRSREEVPQS